MKLRKIELRHVLTFMLSLNYVANSQNTLFPNNGDHIYLVCNDSTIFGLGKNHNGQIGIGNTTYQNSAIAINNINKVKGAFAGLTHSFFIKDDGTVWATGENDYGQLADGSTVSTDTPINLPVLNGIISSIAVSSKHTLFLNNDGTVLGCGSNTYGELGIGNNSTQNSPVQIPSLNNIIDISASCDNGAQHSLFLRNDSTVWACGYNTTGCLGDGTNVDSNLPIQVGVAGITAIAAGSNSSYFLKSDSTVWASGFNSSGQLGLGNTANQSTPVQIPSLSKVIKISAGMLHALFLKEDGTVWSCGNNLVSQLGSSSFGMFSSVVVQVPGISDVVDISAGFQHSLFLKNDGTVWASGFGPFGQSTTLSNLTQISSPCAASTSIHSSENFSDNIQVFPNPATGLITITNIPDNSNVNIVDISGKTIETISMINENTINLNVLHLENGVYFFHVISNGFNTIKKVVVKN